VEYRIPRGILNMARSKFVIKIRKISTWVAESIIIILKLTAVFIFFAAIVLWVIAYFAWINNDKPIKFMDQRNPLSNTGIRPQTKEMQYKSDKIRRPIENFAIEETQSKPTGSQDTGISEDKAAIEYTIQIGVFSSYQNAVALVNSLRADGQTCWMEPKSPSDTTQTTYRVFVGRFRTRKAAEQIGTVLLQRQPHVTGYAIKEIKK
jgi:hypothetical protein